MTDFDDEQVKVNVKHKMNRVGHEWEPDPRSPVEYVEREEEDGRRSLFMRIFLRKRQPDPPTPEYLRRGK